MSESIVLVGPKLMELEAAVLVEAGKDVTVAEDKQKGDGSKFN